MGSIRGYQMAADSVSDMEYRDNWYRTFRGMPSFSDGETGMLKEFAKNNEFGKMVLYLTNEKFGYCLDDDMAEFVVREIIRNV